MEGKTLEEMQELIGEDLYGTLLAEGVTDDSFAKIAERISAARAEGEERLQKYTEAYLAEGIKRCSAALAQGRAEGAAGIMSCPLYSHGWANDDDRQGEVHCCDRRGHEMSWNPEEMEQELKLANIDPASVLAPPDEKPKIGKETCKTYSESWCKGQDCRVCQFNIPGMGPAEVKP